MKKILFMLTAAMLTLTACQRGESFDFLVGEKNIGVDFDYTQVNYKDVNVQAQFEQIFTSQHESWERGFVAEVNDEIEDILMRAYHINANSSAQLPTINYTFMVEITDVTAKGITKANVYVSDKTGKVQKTFEITTRGEYDDGFMESIRDTMEDLGERLGEKIRYGMS